MRGLKTAGAGTSAVDRALKAQWMLEWVTSASFIDWRFIAAIGIRESGFNNVPGKPYLKNGKMTENRAKGIFQIENVSDDIGYDPLRSALWVHRNATNNYMEFQRKGFDFDVAHGYQAMAAAHNFGPDDISGNPDTIDKGTWNGNYGSNILDLMDCFDGNYVSLPQGR